MAAKPQVWRMAFRSGSQGPDYWDLCFRHGVAVLGMWSPHDLSSCSQEDLKGLYRQRCEWLNMEPTSTNLSNHRKFGFLMGEGDIIYAKLGTVLVGRGTILEPYLYNCHKKWLPRSLSLWGFFRKVQWDKNFEPISKAEVPRVFEAPLHTVLQLQGE